MPLIIRSRENKKEVTLQRALMKDLTQDFLALVSIKRKTQDLLNEAFPTDTPRKEIFGKVKVNPFLSSCGTVHSAIEGLEALLNKNRYAYLQVGTMNQEALDIATLDAKASKTIKECHRSIRLLEEQLHGLDLKKSHQTLEHYKSILVYLFERLDRVSNDYHEVRKKRLELTMEQKYGYVHKATSKVKSLQKEYGKLDTEDTEDIETLNTDPVILHEIEKSKDNEVDETLGHIPKKLQMQLRKENWILQIMLDGMSTRVDDVEQQVADISRAQQIIAQNLAKHKDDIVGIQKDSIESEHYFNSGNKELEKALDQGSNRRFIVIIFTFSMALLLLFLHWYD